MPKAGDLQPLSPPQTPHSPNGRRKLVQAWPIGAVPLVYALAQALRNFGKVGLAIDPALWQFLSVGVSFAVGLIGVVSKSPVLVMGFRFVWIRLYKELGLIDRISYPRLKRAIEEAFEADIKPKG